MHACGGLSHTLLLVVCYTCPTPRCHFVGGPATDDRAHISTGGPEVVLWCVDNAAATFVVGSPQKGSGPTGKTALQSFHASC